MKVSLKNAYYHKSRLHWFFDGNSSRAFQIPTKLVDEFIQKKFKEIYVDEEGLPFPKKIDKPTTAMNEIVKKLI